jgi:hypothetical protein
LAIELILEEARAEERVIKSYLDEGTLIQKRSELLSILWALIRHWYEKHEPTGSQNLPSFEKWNEVVAGMIEAVGFASPCQLASLKTGGDTETQDMEHLVAAMVPNTEYRFSDLLALSRDHELFVWLSPAEGEPERCKAQSSAAFSRSSSDAFSTRSGYTAPRLSGTKTSTLTRGIPSRVSRWAYDAILDQAGERGVHPAKICA